MSVAPSLLDGRISVTVMEGNKGKPMYIQVVESANIHQLLIFENESSRRPRHEILLQQAISELYQNDISGKTIAVISPNTITVFAFSSAADAQTVLTFLNSKSDIFMDHQAMAQLDRALDAIWPFPFHE
jgi:hypothetical protein